MKVKSIDLAIQPYGASSGVRALNLDVSPEAEDRSPTDLFEEIKAEINNDELFEDLLTGKLHLVFRSSDGDPVDQREEIIEFLQEGLSNASLDLQVKQLKRESHELRPPFIELHTKGTVFTGQDMFYENFNYVVCDINEIEKPNQPFALVEIAKHAFSTFVFHIQSEDDWATIEKEFIEPKYIVDQRARIFLVAADGTRDEMIERTRAASHVALEQGVRVGVHLGIID